MRWSSRRANPHGYKTLAEHLTDPVHSARPYCGSLDTTTIAANCFEGKSVLVTGGTGSFGQKFAEVVLSHGNPRKLIVLSRDEMKQAEMAQRFADSRLRFFLGDVRDRDRLHRAFQGVDVVVHAAALKQVPAAEYNPFEVVKTNIMGAQNVIDVAIDAGVARVVALSTDKAANPINLYGATKLAADKLFVAANAYGGGTGTRFATVRYGNVVASRGSVIPFFLSRRPTGVLPITHPEMTRFWITLEQGVTFVLAAIGWMRGGEIFVPKIPSMRVVDLARAVAPECRFEVVGIRAGEKLHEVMIPADEARNTFEYDTHYVIAPAFHEWTTFDFRSNGGRPAPEDFAYASDTNDHWLTTDELRAMAGAPLAVASGR
jgi:UDP-N-acetylglucosamine 4,6-dehydratase